MATNNNGNLLDDAGNVAIDFVWGNFPIQPNDDRPDAASATLSTTVTTRVAGRLDPEADNHIIALSGWGGYPQFTADSAGEDVAGDATDYVLVPSVIGLTTALAQDAMKDASLVVTTASAATNPSRSVSAASRTAGSNTLTLTTGANHGYSTGQLVTVSSVDSSANGTWAVLAGSSGTTLLVGTTPTTALSLTGLTGAVVAVAGTIRTQSIAAGANEIAPGAAVTITPWATAS